MNLGTHIKSWTETPSVWEPLNAIVSTPGNFMFMGTYTLTNGTEVHTYKHRGTRRYLNLDDRGQAYKYVTDPVTNVGGYERITVAEAIRHAFS